MNEQMKNALGIKCANCMTCKHLGSESDGNFPEMATHWHVCRKKGNERYENLKPFPFKTEQKCWQPEFWHSKFTDTIDGSDESVGKAIEQFTETVNALA